MTSRLIPVTRPQSKLKKDPFFAQRHNRAGACLSLLKMKKVTRVLVGLVVLTVIVSCRRTQSARRTAKSGNFMRGANVEVPTYGWRRNINGTLVDITDPSHEQRRQLVRSLKIRDSRNQGVASLRADPGVVTNGGREVVSWSNIADPHSNDWIGLYCPSTSDAHEYLDYWFVKDSPTFQRGFGNLTVLLWNMRTDCEFRYYGSDTYTELLAQSNIVTFEGGKAQPLQGHLSLGNSPNEMRIQWVSGVTDTPIVQYGRSSTSLTSVAKGTSNTYEASDMCGPPANTTGFLPPGYIHDVLLTNLTASTTYFYQYGSESHLSNVKQFQTAPSVHLNMEPFHFIVYADMGIQTATDGADMTASFAQKEVDNGAQFILHPGDISYAVGHAYIWDQWHALIEPYATKVPYMVGIGNHEQDHTSGGEKDPSKAPGDGFHPSWGNFGDDSGGECGVPMYHRFHMPDNGNALFWYSFNYGNVHITMMSSEHNYTAGSPQYTWLENDLKSVDRKVTPWLILAGHRPMYSSERYPGDYRVCEGMQAAFEDLLMKYKVDLALWGHYHSYERTCPVYKDECNAEGTTHIVIGSAGASLDSAGLYGKSWSKFFDNEFGYGRITMQNSSSLHWEYIRNKDGVVHDEIWLHHENNTH